MGNEGKQGKIKRQYYQKLDYFCYELQDAVLFLLYKYLSSNISRDIHI